MGGWRIPKSVLPGHFWRQEAFWSCLWWLREGAMDSEHVIKMGHPPLQPSFLQPSEWQKGNQRCPGLSVRQQGLGRKRRCGLSNSQEKGYPTRWGATGREWDGHGQQASGWGSGLPLGNHSYHLHRAPHQTEAPREALWFRLVQSWHPIFSWQWFMLWDGGGGDIRLQ